MAQARRVAATDQIEAPPEMEGEEFEPFAFADPIRRWELVDGRPREREGMTDAHNAMQAYLANQLINQLDPGEFHVRIGGGHLVWNPRNYFIPDVSVVPTAARMAPEHRFDRLETLRRPLALVVEIWSPSTGRYDLKTKLPAYQARGDTEIWHVHPGNRNLHVWRQRVDGGYDEAEYRGARVPVGSLPGVVVDLDDLFSV